MNNRHSQLVLISKRVEKANEQINQVITKLGWTRKELQEWQNVFYLFYFIILLFQLML